MLVSDSDFYCGNASSQPTQLAKRSDIPNAILKQTGELKISPVLTFCTMSKRIGQISAYQKDGSLSYYNELTETEDDFAYQSDITSLKSQIPDVSGYATTSELNSLKSSVSSGKSLVASAVTDKGVQTAADASFQTIANNVRSIPCPPNSAYYDAIYSIAPTPAMAVGNKFEIIEQPTTITLSRYGNPYRTCIARINTVGGTSDYSEIRLVTATQVSDHWASSGMITGKYTAATNELLIYPNSSYSLPENPFTKNVDLYIDSSGMMCLRYHLTNVVDSGDGSFGWIIEGNSWITVRYKSTTCDLALQYSNSGTISKYAYIPWNTMSMSTAFYV